MADEEIKTEEPKEEAKQDISSFPQFDEAKKLVEQLEKANNEAKKSAQMLDKAMAELMVRGQAMAGQAPPTEAQKIQEAANKYLNALKR